jgi:anti-sigma regulatory factor (Ser/Thr protein kinase)
MTAFDASGARHDGSGAGVEDVVDLSIPVRADLVVLARLAAATVGSRAGFDVEEVEDLRLAVDELCVSLVGEGAGGRLSLRFVRGDQEVEVSCMHHPDATVTGDGSGTDPEGLSATILDALVDEHGRDDQDGRQRMWLRKRRARPGS